MQQKGLLHPRVSNIDISGSIRRLRIIRISNSIRKHTKYTFRYLKRLLSPNIDLVLTISIFIFSGNATKKAVVAQS